MRPILALTLLIALTAGLGSAAAQQGGGRVYLPFLATAPGSSSSLDVSAASQLGGAQADQGTAVDIAPDGTLVFGGTLPGYQPTVTPTVLLGGTAGTILRLDRTGRQLLSATRIGASVADLELGPAGVIAVCGDFGVATLDATAGQAVWSAAPGAGRRCAAGSDGTVAALVGGDAVAYDDAGALLKRWAVGGTAQNDIAVDGQNRLVIVTGYNQVSSNLQIPFIRAYGYDGALRWKSYDFPAGTPNLGSADTRGERIAIGRDGKLYFAGSINGGTGVSIFVRDPKDTSKSATDRIVVTDKYTNPFNIGSVKMLWFARFNPADGALELAQSLLTRRSDDKGNSIGASAITADADGTVYLAGSASAFIAERNQAKVAGVQVGTYSGSDAYALVISPDLTQRRLWVPFIGPAGGAGVAQAIAVRGGLVALAGTVTDGSFVTFNPLQAAPGGGDDAYLAVWE